jgi:hypothetical protein
MGILSDSSSHGKVISVLLQHVFHRNLMRSLIKTTNTLRSLNNARLFCESITIMRSELALIEHGSVPY